MLFNSYAFIFLFLPIVLAGYFWLGRRSNLVPVVWLAASSLVFYSVSNWQFVALLLASIAFNYFVGHLLIAAKPAPRWRFAALTVGVSSDLLVLGIFKYAGFFAANLNALFATHFVVNILLPVGISFYTFTQIAFLVDAYRGNVARYALPALRAVRHLFPAPDCGPDPPSQGHDAAVRAGGDELPAAHLIRCGLTIFAIGLFKKTCLADGIQPLVSLAFGPVRRPSIRPGSARLPIRSRSISTFPAIPTWRSACRLMFGIRLPLNFNSPYKARSHHRFLAALAHDAVALSARLSLHPPRRQPPRRVRGATLNLMITMLLGGLWHGAGWTFVIWGALHGVYLCVNHAWSNFGPKVAPRFEKAANVAALILTFLCVVIAWVFFRADSSASALSVLSKMADPGNIALGRIEIAYAVFIAIYAAIAWLAPNTQEMMGYDHKSRRVGKNLEGGRARPLYLYAAAAVLAFGILGIQQHSEFIYFRF